jgi:hypothetical protein
MSLLQLQASLSTYAVWHYALDLRAVRNDPMVTPFQREIGWHRVRAELSRTLGWALFVMLGLSAAGWQINPVLWSGAFFAVMFYWFYAALRGYQMRRRYGVGDAERNHLTGV